MPEKGRSQFCPTKHSCLFSQRDFLLHHGEKNFHFYYSIFAMEISWRSKSCLMLEWQPSSTSSAKLLVFQDALPLMCLDVFYSHGICYNYLARVWQSYLWLITLSAYPRYIHQLFETLLIYNDPINITSIPILFHRKIKCICWINYN